MIPIDPGGKIHKARRKHMARMTFWWILMMFYVICFFVAEATGGSSSYFLGPIMCLAATFGLTTGRAQMDIHQRIKDV